MVSMGYEVELIRKEEIGSSLWVGGTTTQLAIYPKDAIYSERDFKWRLSSAKVEVEESVFTTLPNINRIIMVIEGKLILEHQDHHRSILERFDQDHFSGNWKTKSFGKVTDFNLMMSEGCEGELEHIYINKGQLNKIIFDNNRGFLENVQAIYCVNGQAAIKTSKEETFFIYKGDIVLIKAKGDLGFLYFEMKNEKDKTADLIRAGIYYSP